MRCSVVDLYQVPASERVVTPEGYLRAPARIARTGVQIYSAGSLGLIGVRPDESVRLYRPPEEVFSRAALDSFEGAVVTVNHPAGNQFVDASSWRRLAVGDVVGIHRDGQFVAGTITIRDADAVKLVQAGAAQLSCGYDFDLSMDPGTTPEGERYDGVQRSISGNHVAVVAVGRAGPDVRIGDHGATQGETMKKVGQKKVKASADRPLLGRTKMMSDHAKASAPKSAAAAGGLKGRAAFIAGHKHAGGAK